MFYLPTCESRRLFWHDLVEAVYIYSRVPNTPFLYTRLRRNLLGAVLLQNISINPIMASSNGSPSNRGSSSQVIAPRQRKEHFEKTAGAWTKRKPPIGIPTPSDSPILVVDLEATCWRVKPPPIGQHNEIIEIGWALLDFSNHDGSGSVVTREGTILVKPVRSKVSKFCTELTTITQEMVDEQGVTLEEAFKALRTEGLDAYPWSRYSHQMVFEYSLKIPRFLS